ncbi:ribbon-helix-helix domain-containing protein [Bacillus infantis]|uniref:ribbon-helix-helix domain-containing protein n=1 Tax=Bacillus infantis TaxID=324767 RepID=UPI003CF1F59F
MSLKNRVQFSSTMDTELYKQLKELSEKTRVPLSKLMDAAVESLFLEIERRKTNKTDDDQDDGKLYINIDIP